MPITTATQHLTLISLTTMTAAQHEDQHRLTTRHPVKQRDTLAVALGSSAEAARKARTDVLGSRLRLAGRYCEIIDPHVLIHR